MNNIWSFLPSSNTRQQKQPQQQNVCIVNAHENHPKSEFDFVSMAELSPPQLTPRCDNQDDNDHADVPAKNDTNNIDTQQRGRSPSSGCYNPPPSSSSWLYSTTSTSSTGRRSDPKKHQNLHVTFSADLEDVMMRPLEDDTTKDSAKDQSFSSATTASSSGSSRDSQDDGRFPFGYDDVDIAKGRSFTSATSDINDSDHERQDGTHDNNNDDTHTNNNNKNHDNHNNTSRIKRSRTRKTVSLLQTIRERKRLLRAAAGEGPTFCAVFLLVVGLAALIFLLLALVPHFRSGAHTTEQVYYDTDQDKNFVVSNRDNQTTLEVLALGLIVVLLLGSVCYCGSVALDPEDDNDDGPAVDSTNNTNHGSNIDNKMDKNSNDVLPK